MRVSNVVTMPRGFWDRLGMAVTVAAVVTGAVSSHAEPLAAAPKTAAVMSAEAHAKALASQQAAVGYLLKAQRDDGTWGEPGRGNPATTSLVVRALLGTGKVDARHPAVAKALTYIVSFRQSDGGIYRDELRNYNTAIAIMALHASGLPEYRPVVEAGQAFLLKGQYGADETLDELADPKSPAKANSNYGGNGYGEARNNQKADLSNTAFMATALAETGLKADDPAWKRMQTFLARSQLRSESNDQPFARDYGDDGGFIYGPNDTRGPKTTDPTTGRELLRSYGSMTYAGLKSYLYAGLSKDDPRVKSAWSWVRRNYTLEENPYLGKTGLFYYYMVFAKTMAKWGEPLIEDLRGGLQHNWREELTAKLVSLQGADGSWLNTANRWMEGDPALVTAFALLALEETLR